MVVDEDDAVDLFLGVELGYPVRDRLGVRVAGLIGEAGELAGELEAPEAQRADSAPPHAHPADLLALGAKLALQRDGPPKDLRVERAREPAVCRERNDRHGLLLVALLQQREPAHRGARASRSGHQLEHAVRVRTHVLDARLRSLELRRGDELERARDLPGVPDRSDPPLDVLDGGHGQPTSESVSSTWKDCWTFLISASSFAASSSGRSPLSRISSRTVPSARRCSTSSSAKRGTSVDRNVVEEAVHACVEHRNLFLGRNRLVLRLVEERHHPLTASKGVPGRFVEVGAELSERLQLTVLRQIEAQPARDLFHRLRLALELPTRETEIPTLIAGRTPEKKRSDSR